MPPPPAVEVLLTTFLRVTEELVDVDDRSQGAPAATVHHVHPIEGIDRGAFPGQQVVPQHLAAGLGNRERRATVGAFHSQTIFGGFRIHRILCGIVIEPLGRRSCTTSLVDVDAIVRVVLQHVVHAFRELRLVLVGVRGSDLQR
ncbi:hypothetical protein D9M70_568430 [compost metagenome]